MDMFQILPLEILEKIILQLDTKDLLSCSLVSKSWRSNLNIDIVWRYHCQRKLFMNTAVARPDQNSYDSIEHFSSDLEPLCVWRRIFSWHNNLKNNWIERKCQRLKMTTEKCDSPVFSIDSDGKVAVSGHADSTINVWQVGTEPQHGETLNAMLLSIPVISVRIWKNYIIALQKKLLQVYKQDNTQGYILVHVKSFELSVDRMTLMDKVTVLGDKFDFWYNECLRVNDGSQLGEFTLRRLIFNAAEDLLFASVWGSDELGVWKITGETRACLTGFQSIRSIISCGHKVYIISGGENTLISEYTLSKNETKPILKLPGWKKVVITEEYVVAVPNRMDSNVKGIWVWDKDFILLGMRNLTFGHVSVAPASFLIVYSENSQVTVWDPRNDTVLNTFSSGYIIGFLKPVFSTLMVVFVNNSVHLWDFMEGKRLYRIYSELEWFGDFRDQLWLNPSMIITGGVDKQMELLSFL